MGLDAKSGKMVAKLVFTPYGIRADGEACMMDKEHFLKMFNGNRDWLYALGVDLSPDWRGG
jgi:hypothetical protein